MNVIGGAGLFLFVVKPHLGEQYWFIACIPAVVSFNCLLLRPLDIRIRATAKDG